LGSFYDPLRSWEASSIAKKIQPKKISKKFTPCWGISRLDAKRKNSKKRKRSCKGLQHRPRGSNADICARSTLRVAC
jgi:hypothetical protein